MAHNYKGIPDPQNKLVQGNSISLDIAMLQSDNLYAPTEMDAHVVELDGQYMNLTEFLHTFYPFDLNMFHVYNTSENDKISFQHQTVKSFEFFLVDTILHFYRKDLGKGCIDPCAHMMLMNQLSQYRHLTDLCIHDCSLSFSQIVETMMSQHLYMSNCQSFMDMFGSSIDPRYHHFVVSTRFTNSNCKRFKDIIIKFNFIVCFKGEVFIADIIDSLNLNIHVHHMPTGSNGSAESSGTLDYTNEDNCADTGSGDGSGDCVDTGSGDGSGDCVDTGSGDGSGDIDECMKLISILGIVEGSSSGSGLYTFNNNEEYKSKYGLSTGTYIFQNIPESNPIRIVNEGYEHLISYSGTKNKHVESSGIHYYYGTIVVNVKGDFGSISVQSYQNGPMGGEDILQYTEACQITEEGSGTGSGFGMGSIIRLQIIGEGYFQLKSDDGTIIYTRNGEFIINDKGHMVDKRFGLRLYPLAPSIDLCSNIVNVIFSFDGTRKIVTYNENTGYSSAQSSMEQYRLNTAYFGKYIIEDENYIQVHIRIEDDYFTNSHQTLLEEQIDHVDINPPCIGFHGGIQQHS
jgi:hypothetical protein